MPYSIFISYTQANKITANQIYEFINNEFKGEITLWLADQDISGGDKWKEEIKKGIDKCNAIISLMTPESKNKPWIFLEWGAFWLADKDIYILLSPELPIHELISPMQDVQSTNITDITSVKGFIGRLSQRAKYSLPPYNKAENFVVAIQAAIQEENKKAYESSYIKYRNPLEPIPANEQEQAKLLEFFIMENDEKSYKRVFREIKVDTIKSTSVRQLIQKGRFEWAVAATELIRSPETQSELILLIIHNGYDDYNKLFPLIENMGTKSQPQIRVLLTGLMDWGIDIPDLYNRLIKQFSNMAELRKVGIYLMHNNKLSTTLFDSIINKTVENNRAESRKLGEALIDYGLANTTEFDKTLKNTAAKNQKEAAKLLLHLKNNDITLFYNYIVANIVNDTEAQKLLQD